jgi:hypothetical protein
MPEPANVLITSVSKSVLVVIPEPSPEPVSKVKSEEVLILDRELDAVSDVESVGSVVISELDKSEELVSDEASTLLEASLETDNSDELPTSVETETSSELAVNVSGVGLDEELVSAPPLVSSLLEEALESVEVCISEVAVISELPEALKMVLSSSDDTPLESLSMMSADTLAASELELLSKEVGPAMDDGLVAKDSEELMVLLSSILTEKISLLAVRGVAAEVISDDAVPDGILSDEKTSSSPEPSNSVALETGVAPCQKTNLKFRDTSYLVHNLRWKLLPPFKNTLRPVI